MAYLVHTPVNELSDFIKCFWTLEEEAEPNPEPQRVVPDGCMELIFHYGDLYRQYFENGTSIIQPRCFVFGQISSYIEIAPTGKTGIIAARFLPEGLQSFIDIPVSELDNKAVELATVFGDYATTLERDVSNATNNESRKSIIEQFLVNRLTDPKNVDSITKSCVQAIIDSGGQVGVMELANKHQVNRRNIERKFVAQVGMSPKQLARVVRLQSAIRMLDQKQFPNLTSLAYENGYFDQAHFIKDFKEFTGISPKSFYASNLRFAALFAAAE